MSSNKKNIIFDLDGTLIDVQSTVGASTALVLGKGVPAHICNADFAGLRIYKRPGLDDLLDWCFSNFDNVGKQHVRIPPPMILTLKEFGLCRPRNG